MFYTNNYVNNSIDSRIDSFVVDDILNIDTSNMFDGTLIYEIVSNTFYIYANNAFTAIGNTSKFEENLPFELEWIYILEQKILFFFY